jgi:DNA processing protein
MDKAATAIALLAARGIGPVRIRKFLDKLALSNVSFSDAFSSEGISILQSIGLKDPIDPVVLLNAVSSADRLRREGVDCLVWGDSQYNDTTHGNRKTLLPPILFARGDTSILHKKSVGFSGSRNVSDEGVVAARGIVSQLVEAGADIVSGGARGVDTACHVAALEAGGTTTMVLPEGLAGYRPTSEIQLLANVDNTLMISEFHPTATWQVSSAMQRNKTICGLSDVVIIIEARKDGGTMNTGENALKHGIPLFVVEYGATFPHNEGNASLLKAGAIAIRKNKSRGLPNVADIVTAIETRIALPVRREAASTQLSLLE